MHANDANQTVAQSADSQQEGDQLNELKRMRQQVSNYSIGSPNPKLIKSDSLIWDDGYTETEVV